MKGPRIRILRYAVVAGIVLVCIACVKMYRFPTKLWQASTTGTRVSDRDEYYVADETPIGSPKRVVRLRHGAPGSWQSDIAEASQMSLKLERLNGRYVISGTASSDFVLTRTYLLKRVCDLDIVIVSSPKSIRVRYSALNNASIRRPK